MNTFHIFILSLKQIVCFCGRSNSQTPTQLLTRFPSLAVQEETTEKPRGRMHMVWDKDREST